MSEGKPDSKTTTRHDELAEIFVRAESLVLGPRVLNKRRHGMPPRSVYIGRPGKWGNPFEIGKDGTRADVIAKHRAWICDQPVLIASLPELRGRDLVCWCAPAACHGDTLKELANAD